MRTEIIEDLEFEFGLYYDTDDTKRTFYDFINRLCTDLDICNLQLDIRTLFPEDGYITKSHIKKMLDWHNDQLSTQTRIIYVPLYDIPMV